MGTLATPPSDVARRYSRTNGGRFRRELHDLLRIPSVSTDPARAVDVRRAGDWLAAHLGELGLTGVSIHPTAGHPVVYGEWLGAGEGSRTVLVYGHYDVVPAAMEDGWATPPFEPVERDGSIYARGATDDKGQLFIQIKALESYLRTSGAAPVNVKLLLEGEEEVSSPNLRPFLAAHLDLLSADVCVISDSSMRRIDEPAILHSLRGMTYIEVEVQGPTEDLHRGFWGGAVHNPALVPVEILTNLHQSDRSVAVPRLSDDVVPSEEQPVRSRGVCGPWGEATYSIREPISACPTPELNGLRSGWTRRGARTMVPARAMAKISCRLVGNQDPLKIYERLKERIEALAPPTATATVTLVTTGEPALVDFRIPELRAAALAYRKAWGANAVLTRGGGSIPVVADITNLLRIPVVMMGYGLDDDGLHGPNEHLGIEMFHRGIETAIVYLEEVARLPRGR